MSASLDLTADVARAALEYDASTGLLRWRHRDDVPASFNGRYAGKTAGRPGGRGYIYVNLYRRCYKAHRMAWLISYGEWPAGAIDHINRDKTDNRLNNLRFATPSQNSINSDVYSSNRSGVRGVTWHAGISKWQAQIGVAGKVVYLGSFDRIEDAAAARADRERQLFGAFSGASDAPVVRSAA